MTESFFIKPFLALIFATLTSAILGVFVLWKKLSYFGDAISHSILLGAAISVLLAGFLTINQSFLLILFAISFAFLVGFLAQNRYFSKDVVITISSYFCVALAILLNEFFAKDFNFSDYIFGNIENAQSLDIVILAAVFIATIIFTFFTFKKILLANLAPDLAKIENIKIAVLDKIFLVLLTITIAILAHIAGILLVTALVVLPAAIARLFSKSPWQMLFLSAIIALCSATLCFAVSWHFKISVAPFLVLVLSMIFMFGIAIKNR